MSEGFDKRVKYHKIYYTSRDSRAVNKLSLPTRVEFIFTIALASSIVSSLMVETSVCRISNSCMARITGRIVSIDQ